MAAHNSLAIFISIGGGLILNDLVVDPDFLPLAM
jgi:hypothetical protein